MNSQPRFESRMLITGRSAVRFRTVVAAFVAACVAMMLPATPAAAQQAEIKGPYVRKLQPPKRMTQDLRQLPVVRPWRVGDPVRVIEDLKEQIKPDSDRPRGGEEQPRQGSSQRETGASERGVSTERGVEGGRRGAPPVQRKDLRQLPPTPQWREGDPVREVPLGEPPGRPEEPPTRRRSPAEQPDSPASEPGNRATGRVEGLEAAALAFAMGVNFDGIPATGSIPPDTVGDVGSRHYIQAVNVAFAVYDKAGNLLAGPSPINALWAGFGGPCETLNNGDPVVRYDHRADRWLISQFALPGGTAGFHLCVAVSQTADPVAGGWFLYDFPTTDAVTGSFVFPDYPKIGVWPDAYYVSTQRSFFAGLGDVWALERDEMLAGNPAGLVQFSVASASQTIFLLPSDLDGSPPPGGTPNFFVRPVDGERFGGGGDRLEIFAFSVDWSNPAASTFALVATLPTAPFDSVLCSATLIGLCIPQPATPQRLESLTVWPMWRLQFRNFGVYETLVTNHTVDADSRDTAGIRWYELRRPSGGAWEIFQQGTHAPGDGVHRWMGSMAMDRDGGIALGYSVSSREVSPGLRAAGREVGDPAGTLPAPETIIVAGGGSQTHSSGRWGNYTSLDVDPTDDCTFWYTGQYYQTTSTAGWRTRIASFTHPNCGQRRPEPRPTYQYAAKLVCGIQRDPADMRLARGFYATTINVHNPNRDTVRFAKKLALTYPPEGQRPGKILPIARDLLRSDEALAVDCNDLQRRLFGGQFPTPYIEGFVVIEALAPLDVTGVYTTAALGRDGRAGDHSSMHVEQVRERLIERPEARRADLIVSEIDLSARKVDCPTGQGSCVTTVPVTVANIGGGDAGPFNVRVVLDPGQGVVVNQPLPGLAAGATRTFTATTPPGANCFDPDCTICAIADDLGEVVESNETNNQLCRTTLG